VIRTTPEIEVFEHCDCSDLEIARLLKLVRLAFPLCLEQPGREPPDLPKLCRLEINIVSDQAIAKIHGEFMDDPTPTDVITFHHGEIFVSADTARSGAPGAGSPPWKELLLYAIHGFLHLNGHVDQKEPDRSEMYRIQNEILEKITEVHP